METLTAVFLNSCYIPVPVSRSNHLSVAAGLWDQKAYASIVPGIYDALLFPSRSLSTRADFAFINVEHLSIGETLCDGFNYLLSGRRDGSTTQELL